MSKCGKGCMPECEYFTTGGCISPFNCPYKIETGYINTATSVIGSYTQGKDDLNEPKIKKWFRRLVEEGKIHQEPANYDAATLKIYIDHLEKENAALRERLDKAVELPCKRKRLLWGDKDKETLLCPDCLTDLMGGIGDETFVVQCPNCGCFVDCMVEPIPFTEAAEARLAELKGGG